MKKIIGFLLLTTLSSMAFAQKFKIQESTRRADFAVCQDNHLIILNKFIAQADNQIGILINGIQIETSNDVRDEHLSRYRQLLIQTLTKKIALQELKKQLVTKDLSRFYNIKSNYNLPLLDPNNIKVDFIKAIEVSIDEIKKNKKLKIGKAVLDKLKNQLLKESALLLISKQYRHIAAGLLTRIVTQQAGQVATSTVLKSATVSFTSQLFVNAGTGLLLQLLTFPLHAYRLPPESEWLNLLEEHPEVIIVPEWMSQTGIHDHPWNTHCNTIQRETKRLEKMLDRALKADDQGVKSAITLIFNIYSRTERDEPTSGNRYDHQPAVIDNTYVHRPYFDPKSLGPFWMRH